MPRAKAERFIGTLKYEEVYLNDVARMYADTMNWTIAAAGICK
jgi:hypothetical protein